MSEARKFEPAGMTDMGRKTLTNSLWSYLSFALQKGATFFATLVLVRVLSPDDFGLMGYCLLTIAYLEVFGRFGLDAALISRQDRIEAAADVTFMFALANGFFFFLLAWFAAPAIAEFFREEAITPLFRVLAVVLVIEATAIVHLALLQRDLRFRDKLRPDIARGIVKGVVAIGFAVAGYGVWSLVIGQIAGSLVFAILLWVLVPWRPTFRFDRRVAREMFGFGSHMAVVNLMGAMRNNMDYLLIGRLLGATSLGLYTISYRLPDLVIQSLNNVVGMVTHPVLARIQSDRVRTREYYEAYVRHIAMLTLPAGIGMAIIAEPFVHLFYTDRWNGVIFPMQCISLALAVSSIGFVPGVLLKAINRPDVLNYISLVKLPFIVLILWYATGYGIEGVAIAQVVLAAIYLAFDSMIMGRMIGFGLKDLLAALWPALIATTVMALVDISLAAIIVDNDLLELPLLIIAGSATYLFTLRLVARDFFDAAIGTLRATP
jgi:O-antigen/teichoic acid export membrane protein